MLINLWTTPRTGSNWYARKLARDYGSGNQFYSLNELFNQNIYSYYYRNVDERIYFLKDYSPGCYYEDFVLDSSGIIVSNKVYNTRSRSPLSEEQHRMELVRAASGRNVMVLSNHVSPINADIYKELYRIADRNIFLHRNNIKDQLSSYCISYATKQFVNFHSPGVLPDNICVELPVIENIAHRILHWHSIKKSPLDEIVSYESIDFGEHTDAGMPTVQYAGSSLSSLDYQTHNRVLEMEKYINGRIVYMQQPEAGVLPLEYHFDASRILEIVKSASNTIDMKLNQIFITTAPDTSTHYSSTYMHDKDAQRQFVKSIDPSTVVDDRFTNTYIEEVVLSVKAVIESRGLILGRVRILRMPSRACYAYHRDPDVYRFHIPLYVKNGNFFIVDDKLYTLDNIGQLYQVKTSELHTAVNASTEDRYHLVFDTYI